MRAVVVESFVAGLLLLTAACVSSATASSGGVSGRLSGGMVGGGADGSLNGSPTLATADAQATDGAVNPAVNPAADPAVCAALTTPGDQAAPDAHVLNQEAHQTRGPLSLLVSSLVIETADGRPAVDVVAAIRTVCGAQAADAANAANVEVCDALEQDWLAAADQTVAAADDAHARADAISDLADRAASDVASLPQNGDDHSVNLTAAARGIKDGATAQSAIAAAAECTGLDQLSRR